jgi:hypothetical protein
VFSQRVDSQVFNLFAFLVPGGVLESKRRKLEVDVKDVLHYTPPFNASVVVHDKSVSGGNGTGIFKKGTVTGGAVWDNQYKRVHVSDNSTSLDLIGHEFAHGIHLNLAGGKLSSTNCHGNPLKCYGETGGLAEATGDIFGTMAECYAKNKSDVCDWKFADEIPGLGDKYRYMNNSAMYDSNTKNLEVHSAALPADNFFYRLVTKFKNNDDGRKYAAMIWFEALTHMSSGTQYSGARKSTVGAARDLAADGKIPDTAVTYVQGAWSAVGVSQQPGE